MQQIEYNIVRNDYGDALVPYEIAKAMYDNGYTPRVHNEICLNGKMVCLERTGLDKLTNPANEIISCPTVSEAMRWINVTRRTYVKIDVTAGMSCQPQFGATLIKLPLPEDCDQGWPCEYVDEIPNGHWHVDSKGDDLFRETEIFRESLDETYLDVLAYLLDVKF